MHFFAKFVSYFHYPLGLMIGLRVLTIVGLRMLGHRSSIFLDETPGEHLKTVG